MLRYKTETRPGLVALYDIRPGNGEGPFLQPRSPHGAGNNRNKQTTEMRQRQRQTDRQTDRDKDKQTERQTDEVLYSISKQVVHLN